MKRFEYNFPLCNQYGGTLAQLSKIAGEANEALDAYVNNGDMLGEVMDVIHACETLLREYDKEVYGSIDMQLVYESTVEKNRARGYYEMPCNGA